MDPLIVLMFVAAGGLGLTVLLLCLRVIRPQPYGDRFRALGRLPGETGPRRWARVGRLALASVIAAAAVATFGLAVVDLLPGSSFVAKRTLAGAMGVLVAFVAVLCAGRRSSTDWPRGRF